MINEIIIDTTNSCPLHCKYCGTDSNTCTNFLKTTQIKSILENYNSKEIKIFLGGGYFFFHPDWKKILEYNKKIKANLIIDTPLVLNTLKTIREYKLKEYYYKVSLSLWGSEVIHNTLTNSNSFNNLFILQNELQKQNESIQLSFVLTKELIEDIANLKIFLDSIKCETSIYFHRHMPCGRTQINDLATIESLLIFKNTICDYVSDNKIITVNFHHTLVSVSCYAWKNRIFINHNGDIWGCGWINNLILRKHT